MGDAIVGVLFFLPVFFVGFYMHCSNHRNKLLRKCESYKAQIARLEEQLKQLSAEKDREIERLTKDLAYYCDLSHLLVKRNLPIESNVYQSLSKMGTPDIRNRVLRAFQEAEHYTFSFFNVYANVKRRENSARSYTVTLNHCTCPDYSFRGKPCKHMYMLALQFALFQEVDLHGVQENLTALLVQSNDLEQKIRKEKEILQANEQKLPWLAKMFSEYELARGNADVNYLRQKRPPAPKAADEIRSYASRNAELTLQNKELEHQLTFYENCFPWLVLFKQLSVENALWVTELAETRGLIDDSAMLELMDPYLPQNDQEFKS